MAAEGMHVDPEDMLVTTGGQQVIDLVTQDAHRPGRRGGRRGPDLPGRRCRCSPSYQADVVQIDMDADGMRVDLLEEALDRLDREGRRPKFIYTVPSFQNPAGVTMSQPRRQRLVEVAHERELLVLEDNPYGLLRYEGEPPTAAAARSTAAIYVMYLGTFSKILSPGIRLGWVVAPPPVLEKINLGKQAADLCTSTLSQLMVQAYFAEGRWRDYVESLTEIYRARRDTMLDALADHFPPQAEWTRPVRRPVHLGDAAGLHRHDRPARPRAPARTWRSCRARRRSWTAAAATRCGSTSQARTRTRSARGSAASARS